MVIALSLGVIASLDRPAYKTEGSNSLSVGEIPGKLGFGLSSLQYEKILWVRWFYRTSFIFSACCAYAARRFSSCNVGIITNSDEEVNLAKVCCVNDGEFRMAEVAPPRVNVCTKALCALKLRKKRVKRLTSSRTITAIRRLRNHERCPARRECR